MIWQAPRPILGGRSIGQEADSLSSNAFQSILQQRTSNALAAMSVPATLSPTKTFGEMLGPDEKCTLSLGLWVRARYTNGDGRLSGYNSYNKTSFGLETIGS